jgi:hypothetical protein
MSGPIESHCVRCLRSAPDEDDRSIDALEWEVLTDDEGEVVGVLCPECVTPEERQAADETFME